MNPNTPEAEATEDALRERVREALTDYRQWLSVAVRAPKPYTDRDHLLVSHTQIESAMRLLWMD